MDVLSHCLIINLTGNDRFSVENYFSRKAAVFVLYKITSFHLPLVLLLILINGNVTYTKMFMEQKKITAECTCRMIKRDMNVLLMNMSVQPSFRKRYHRFSILNF